MKPDGGDLMMRTTIAAVIGLVLLSVSPGHAQEGVPFRGEPYPVNLVAGEIFKVCKSGQIICPAIGPICDDLKVAIPVDTPDGLGFKGVGPGTTLCSAGNESGLRRVFRISVR